METRWRIALFTAIAPITWGSTYLITHEVLPASAPLWGGALRGFPAGLLLLAIARRLPTGSWWWKSLVLGTINVGAFFVLVYESAQLLPSSVAAPVMALAPIVMMLFAWALMGERPYRVAMIGAVLGIIGVIAIVAAPVDHISLRGVMYSVVAMAMSSFGYVLAKRWDAAHDILGTTAWQLVAGGGTVVIAAFIVEGPPPTLDGPALAGFAYLSICATALAYIAWFTGIAKLPVGTVGLIGLLNPVTGVVLGTMFGNETLTIIQIAGIILVLFAIRLGQRVPKSVDQLVLAAER
jgi:probable blue pigment (indigoidine) exporter